MRKKQTLLPAPTKIYLNLVQSISKLAKVVVTVPSQFHTMQWQTQFAFSWVKYMTAHVYIINPAI